MMNVSGSDRMAKTRQSVLDVEQRNQLESIQAALRRNNESLTSLRRENKELRSVLQQSIRGQRNINVEDHYSKEEDLLHNKMCVLKRSLNAVKGKNTELLKEIERTIEENRFVQQEGNGALEEDSAVAHKIRALENRLDKCLVKHNEVNTIRRTYETLLERLQLEQAGFNTQVSSTEQALQCADKELGELVAVWKSAAKARDAAKAEVGNLKLQLVAERQKQRKDLDERRAFIDSKRQQLEKKNELMMQKLAQQEERHARTLQSANSTIGGSARRRAGHRSGAGSAASFRPEELEHLQKQKAAYLRLREVAMASNVTDLLSKIRERSAHHVQLQTTASELEASMQLLEEEKEALQTAWEEVNHRAGHALVTARVMRAARDKRAAGSPVDGALASGAAESEEEASGNAGPAGSGEVVDYGLMADHRHERRLVLEEFRQHLHQRMDELEEAEDKHNALAQLLREVDLGVQYLAEKLSISGPLPMSTNTSSNTSLQPPSQSSTEGARAPAVQTNLTIDLLRSCGAKLQLMMEELSPEELESVARSMNSTKFKIAGTNVRVPEVLEAQHAKRHQQTVSASRARGSFTHLSGAGGLVSPQAAAAAAVPAGTSASTSPQWRGGGSPDNDERAARTNTSAVAAATDDYPENEIHDRQELKMMSIATVEREQQKARKRQLQQRRNKEEMA